MRHNSDLSWKCDGVAVSVASCDFVPFPGLMRHSPVEVKKRLLSALDEDSNVIDMAVVLDVVSILEQLPISREALEATRLGKHINDLRKKTQDASLAKRAKALVRRWRDMIIPQQETAVVVPAVVRRSPPAASPRSYPSSANTSPCLSRSTTPGLSKLSPGLVRNVTLQPISPAPPTPARPRAPAADAPPPAQAPDRTPDKTDAANKRKRKAESVVDGDERADKRPRLNGVQDECSRDSISGEINADVPAAARPVAQVAKKARRSRSAVTEPASFDDLTEKLASVARTPRVKTTRQLLSDLAERSGDSSLARRASQFPAAEAVVPRRASHDLTRNKSAHIEKFLNSQGGKRRVPARPSGGAPIETIDLEGDDESVTAVEPAPAPPPPEPPRPWPTEAEILARLPPLNEDEIVWSDDEPDEAPRSSKPGRLGGEHLENINGNTNHEGEFREWHQVVTASLCDGHVLSMLPYVIID